METLKLKVLVNFGQVCFDLQILKFSQQKPSVSKAGLSLNIGVSGVNPEPLTDTGWMIRLPGERDLLKAFLNIMNTLDPDIMIGWHVIGFDLKFLEKKYREHGIAFNLGRNRRTPEIRETKKGSFSVDICGRIVIDGPPSLRAAFYSFENFRLETVASKLLGRGKDIGQGQGYNRDGACARRMGVYQITGVL